MSDMKKNVLLFTCVSIFCFMSVVQAKITVSETDKKFDEWKQHFVEELWKVYPAWASSVGYHKYDDVLIVPDDAARTKELDFCKKSIKELAQFNPESLSDANKTDYHLVRNQLGGTLWSINLLKAWEWDPSTYNISGSFAEMLSNNYEPLDNRLNNFYKRMANIPAYYEAAKRNISSPTKEHTALAIEQNLGGVSVFTTDLEDALGKSGLSDAMRQNIKERAATAITAIKDYADWLKKLKNDNPRSFRLGKELYDQKFNLEMQSGYTADQIYEKALQHKKDLHDDMIRLTRQLWPKYFSSEPMPDNELQAIRKMIDKLSLKHVTPDSFQSAIDKQIPELIAFINAKNLIYIDPSKPLVVRKEPAYMAGVAGASITSPGPYDKNGNTYYNVGSLSGWDKDKAESYLREYNHYILQILNIHEAIPGHYTQLVYANQSPSIIKAILGNNAMIEGWAVYTERMMLENGYDGDKGTALNEASPEMWLMYYKWNLRSTCNTILDYSVHTKNMSRDEALSLLQDEAFQQKGEAEGKWKRVSVTQVQLCCYFTGYTEIYDFRQELKNKKGDKFSLKQFHEQFLSYGSAPVKYIRELMMKEL
jgi:uncharacterized protein (DUF885 family)